MSEPWKKEDKFSQLNDEEKRSPMPYYQHDIEMARLSLQAKRLFILAMTLLFLFVATNAWWIWYEMQFETIRIEQEGDTDTGGSLYFNGTGEMNLYGERETDNSYPQEENGW